MSPSDSELAERRRRMVETQLRARGIRDARVLEAMAAVPRHRFVDPREVELAYGDFPIDIGLGQTISQPYIVAYMSEALQLAPHHTVLEIGAGSGYQTAVLAGLVREVYSIEIVPEHARRAAAVLGELGFHNVHVREGDGYQGWPEHAPYDAVIVTAAPDHIPQPLVEQLADRRPPRRPRRPLGSGSPRDDEDCRRTARRKPYRRPLRTAHPTRRNFLIPNP